MAEKTLYDWLELLPWAREEVIRASYRALVGIYHPDKPTGDLAITKKLNEAHETLSDPEKRRHYDERREDLQGRTIGEYRILDLIAEGSYGRTYLGEHVVLGEPVCIKDCSSIDPQMDEVLVEEAKVIWHLAHYGMPAVRSLIRQENGRLLLVMAYMPGPTLEQIIQKSGRMDPENVAWITDRILNVLYYLHYHGVVHGDIKPQNVIIQPSEHTVAVVDYGLSVIRPTMESDSKGYTPLFAPPEQEVEGPAPTPLPESDFYSLGMTMIYALSGGLEHVKRREVPQDTPDPMVHFIRRLLVRDFLSRPNWVTENLCNTIEDVRIQSFGRARSDMMPIPGF